MSSVKKVKYLLPTELIDMGGFPVGQALPTAAVNQVDPFLLLHHGETKYSKDRPAKHQGIGPHPHRGFSPVTFVYGGAVHHRDSRGNNQIAKKGDVQWMNAGAGIIHSERPEEESIRNGEKQKFIQLWINSPADSKMKPPYYQHIARENMPVITSDDDQTNLYLIAGDYADQSSTTVTESDLLILWAESQGGTNSIDIPDGFNAMIYVISGEIKIEGYGKVEGRNLVVFSDEGDKINLSSTADSSYLVLAGRPLDEKIEQYGPFVMNNQTEIMEAMRDYQMGKMGVLIEDEMN